MKMMNGIIVVLFLLGASIASGIVCTGNSAPNLGTTLYLNCTTQALPSTCWALVSDNESNIIGYYPKNSFTSDKETFFSTEDGKFVASIPVSEPPYSLVSIYSAEVSCVANDSSVNLTVFNFTPVTYTSPDWIGNWLVYLRDNVGFAFAALLAAIFLAIIIGYLFKKTTGR